MANGYYGAWGMGAASGFVPSTGGRGTGSEYYDDDDASDLENRSGTSRTDRPAPLSGPRVSFPGAEDVAGPTLSGSRELLSLPGAEDVAGPLVSSLAGPVDPGPAAYQAGMGAPMEYAPGVSFGMTPTQAAAIRSEAPAMMRPGGSLYEGQYQGSPDWGTSNLSLEGMARDANARKMIEDKHAAAMRGIATDEAARRATIEAPQREEFAQKERAAKMAAFEAAVQKPALDLARQARVEAKQQAAQAKYDATMRRLDQELAASRASGGQPGKPGRPGMLDDRGYQIAQQQAWREFVLAMQVAAGGGGNYAGFVADPRLPENVQFSLGTPGATAPASLVPEGD
jgi:hypothetical protein